MCMVGLLPGCAACSLPPCSNKQPGPLGSVHAHVQSRCPGVSRVASLSLDPTPPCLPTSTFLPAASGLGDLDPAPSGDHSMVAVLCHQRDRFRARVREAEEELAGLRQQLARVRWGLGCWVLQRAGGRQRVCAGLGLGWVYACGRKAEGMCWAAAAAGAGERTGASWILGLGCERQREYVLAGPAGQAKRLRVGAVGAESSGASAVLTHQRTACPALKPPSLHWPLLCSAAQARTDAEAARADNVALVERLKYVQVREPATLVFRECC